MQEDFLIQRLEEENPPRKEIRAALSYILTHFKEPELKIEEIARSAMVSQDTLESMFKQWKGITIVHYILELRLFNAAMLLEETDEPVNFIAFSTGFDNTSYFNKVFKTKFKINPKEFRQRKKQLRKK